jgi:radical SAM superfamily enzyme YgiQ (UPF0313 family)
VGSGKIKESILRRLQREQGTIYKKEWERKVHVCLLYPNTYWVGMSNLGFQTIYRLLNEREDTVCERSFLPEEPALYKKSFTPLLSYESRRALWEFDILAFSISFELDYLNLPLLFELAHIPPFSPQRRAPFIVAGGIAPSINPLSIQGFFDAIFIGEAEDAIDYLLKAYKEEREKGKVLERLRECPHFYVPSAKNVKRAWKKTLPVNTSTILTPFTEFGSQLLLEVSRGCGRGCRFCVAGFFYRPQRQPQFEAILETLREDKRIFKRVGFVGTSVCDYTLLLPLCEALRKEGKEFVLPSIRPDSLCEELLPLLTQKSISIGIETTSSRLQRRINKSFSCAALLKVLEKLGKRMIVRFYVMIGLPGQEDEDIKECAKFLKEAERIVDCSVNVSCFVPKPHTPFQYSSVWEQRRLSAAIKMLKKELPRMRVRGENPKRAMLQAALSWGKDMHLVIYSCYKKGLPILEVLQKEGFQKVEPQNFINSGIQAEYLQREFKRAEEELLTPPCSKECGGCGLCV